ncbi:TonB C-terminal domain-containing protein [Acidobacteria bacterium ACD]|nr:MAG: TonB family protein [Acidobacteriota bacterium]MCE7956987.1 TonB family protein [Acidobacteria bacterium ACB2]MDL1950330.1 TonB C-terminal domain-containing protein [Acidobacteria bacterium ACD]
MPRTKLLAALLPFALVLALPLAGAPRPSLNAYFQSTLKDAAYQQKVFGKVAAAWVAPPATSFPKPKSKTVVQAVITKAGKLGSAEVTKTSGSKAWDEAALSAVRKGAPFDPLPPGYGYPTLEVHFHVSLEP